MTDKRLVAPIGIGSGSLVALSAKPATDLIVFVHGFKGSARSTWDDFIGAIQPSASLDLLFYGYNSRPSRLQSLAYQFRQDMLSLLTLDVRSFLTPTVVGYLEERDGELPREAGLHFVAHSLGTVIVRRALIDCLRSEDDSQFRKLTPRSKLFFAPAHKGSDITKLWGTVLSQLPINLDSVLQIAYPVLRDLQPNCASLNELITDYHALQEHDQRTATASRIVTGSEDAVVEQQKFGDDPVTEYVAGRNHRDICKPTAAYPDPVDKLYQTI